ncbi:MAG: DEAD/DEAH box helicase [Nitriliruptorales bacterium]|nr:DEAD/DEAH box helicase [Nitriliruptorales bacterium]
MALDRFSPPVREWFTTTFAEPTAAQEQGWPAIAAGEHTLILAPTGSGKTLTAFLWAIDRLMTVEVPSKERRLRVLYISPLRALAVDVDKNLRAPLRGIHLAGERLGTTLHEPTVGVRTGDTPSKDRQQMVRTPPDILITTPESLYLLLTSRARETLRNIDVVIIDEIHALAATKRGSHLALSLERLEALTDTPPQRIALSATQRPLDEIARFLGGYDDAGQPRPVTVVDAGISKELDIEVVVPVEDMGQLGEIVEPETPAWDGPASAAAGPTRKSIWPAMHPRLLDLILEHRSTIVFVNARRLAERLAAKLNELHTQRLRAEELRERGLDPDSDEALELLSRPIPELVRAHHGSLSKERRLAIEDELKAGTLRGIVATSSLELGIDMGAVDLVVQVESPGAVSRGLQRIGRAGHQVGEPSRGKLFPKYRGDLVELAVVVDRMKRGAIEATRYPRKPLDVLAQHLVAMSAMDAWQVDDLLAMARRAAPFHELSEEVLHTVLDLLSGRYPSDEFSELRPRIVWDRVGGSIRGRPGAQRLAVTNPGTIPDRGLFGVFLPDGTRVGELDEEMVFESRPGETFILGASTWRIEDITHERVVVTPAPGEPGKMPFWHGDGPGRPYELGRALGSFIREIVAAGGEDRDGVVARLQDDAELDAWAADNLVRYLEEQAAATGAVPDDRTVVVERFRDEIGDWRVCLLSPFGARVHAPWAMAIERRLQRAGIDAEILWADDGIVLRVQESVDELPVDELLVDPDEVEELVVEQLAGTALFTTTFREAAGRALLLPKRRPGQRTALWQQRQRAANLLQVAANYPDFPVLLEATRECLQDIFDLPALKGLLTDLRSRRIRVVPVDSEHASPFAQSLLFAWVGQYMYEYDSPLAERRAAALSLDRDLLRELLGGDELRELLDADAIDAVEAELQRLTEGRRARHADDLHALLLHLGDLTLEEVAARSDGESQPWLTELLDQRRAIEVVVAGQERYVAAEDAARYRDALGTALPRGLPAAFTDPVARPLVDLVARYARTHGPFLTREVAHRLGVDVDRIAAVLGELLAGERVLLGEFRPDGVEREWCDSEVLRRIRRRSLAALRREVEPVDPDALGRFLVAWHGVGSTERLPEGRGLDGVADAVARLQAAPVPASVLESDVLPARVTAYRPADLDQLLATGEVVWFGAEPIGSADGRLVLCFRDHAALLAPAPPADLPDGEVHEALRAHLAAAGASFWPELLRASGVADEQLVLDALWDLVWSGEVTNDTFAPIRGLLQGRRRSSGRTRPRPGRLRRIGPAAAQGRWSLTRHLREPAPSDTEIAHARAEQLLERHGIVTREGVNGEGVPGGFSGVYPVLKLMEETGRIRRGYFVEGLGAAQFAVPGAVDRLRSVRETDQATGAEVVVLAATDPAQPYGAALSWPDTAGRPARAAGAYVVLVDGEPGVYVERGGRSLVTFPSTAAETGWVDGLLQLVKTGRVRKLEITKIDGEDPAATDIVDILLDAGFTQGYRGLTLRG